jgi:cytosine/adenosine deaminase-related metal-dependent hydrolase
MKRLLKGIHRLYTCDDNERVLDQAYVVVVRDKIAELGSGAAPAGDFDEIIDLEGCLVAPGFVNVHHHFRA